MLASVIHLPYGLASAQQRRCFRAGTTNFTVGHLPRTHDGEIQTLYSTMHHLRVGVAECLDHLWPDRLPANGSRGWRACAACHELYQQFQHVPELQAHLDRLAAECDCTAA